jgi:pimeloyl-ACP methyl ester carboxylesterase
MFVFQTPLAEMIVTNDDLAFIDYLWSYWSPGYTPEPAFMRSLKDTLSSPGSAAAAIDYYRFMLGTRPTDPDLTPVRAAGSSPTPIPTLYLHGMDDGCMGVEIADRAILDGQLGAGSDVQIVPASGHFLHLEQPADVHRRILDFLAG